MRADYTQPDFYRFNQDSLRLVDWVQTKISAASSILDLGAGCGIMGIELARFFLPERLTLVELQREYEPYLLSNLENFLPPTVKAKVLIKGFSEYEAEEKFQVIVSNPPYYLPGRGEQANDILKAKARSFLVDSWSVLLQRMAEALEQKGKGFVVLKKDDWLFRHILSQTSKLIIEREDSDTVMFLSLRLNVD